MTRKFLLICVLWLVIMIGRTRSAVIYNSHINNQLKIFQNKIYYPIVQPCEPGFVHVGKKCLLLIPLELSWFDAYKVCYKKGLSVLSLVTGNEFHEFVQEFGDRGGNTPSYWTAAHLVRGQWEWLLPTKAPINPGFWTPNFETGISVQGPPNDRERPCGFLDGERFLFLSDSECQVKRRLVCQKEAKEVNPIFLHPFGHEVEAEGNNTTTESLEPLELIEEKPKPVLECKAGYELFNTTCYHADKDDAFDHPGYIIARYYCSNMNEALVLPRTAEEKNFLIEKFANESIGLWVPVRYSDNENETYYIDDDTADPADSIVLGIDETEQGWCVYFSTEVGGFVRDSCQSTVPKRAVCVTPATEKEAAVEAPAEETQDEGEAQ